MSHDLEDKTIDAALKRIRSGMNISMALAVLLVLTALVRGAFFGGWDAAREPLLIGTVLLLVAEAVGFIATIWQPPGDDA